MIRAFKLASAVRQLPKPALLRRASTAAAASKETDMFCFQCEQTDQGTGCTTVGVCGKDAETATLQDLLLSYNTGLAHLAKNVQEKGGVVSEQFKHFLLDGSFSTLTNVNFDADRFYKYLGDANTHRNTLLEQFKSHGGNPDTLLPVAKFGYVNDPAFLRLEGKVAGLQQRKAAYGNADAFGLREMAQYGLKGTMAYFAHAERIWEQNNNAYSREDREDVFTRLYGQLEALAIPSDDINHLVRLNLDVGGLNFKIMELLDTAHTETYGRPSPHTVSTIPAEGKCILVSGHDMVDIYELLKQTEGTGINIYTHGEMLPAHGYPHLRAFPHLKGHYGTAWQNQKLQFAKFPGPILMTSNCIVEPRPAYRDRIYTTNSVGVHGIKHIPSHDFSEVIQCALDQPGFIEKHTKAKTSTADMLTVGFGHRTIESVSDQVLDAIKKKQIGNIFVIGGCDGNEMERSYYTDVANKLPDDALILTMGCGKFRINGLDLGTVGGDPNGLPRMLDVGQCNDAYSAVKVALLLANALNTGVNDLPLNLCISWFEQKAVAVLLTLLHLNIQRIRLGPNLPAFITPNMLTMLAEAYKIRAADAEKVDEDLKQMLAHN